MHLAPGTEELWMHLDGCLCRLGQPLHQALWEVLPQHRLRTDRAGLEVGSGWMGIGCAQAGQGCLRVVWVGVADAGGRDKCCLGLQCSPC